MKAITISTHAVYMNTIITDIIDNNNNIITIINITISTSLTYTINVHIII